MLKANTLIGIYLPKLIHISLGIFLLILIGFGVQVANYGTQSSENTADVAIVLGAAVYRGVPSPVFRERINHAIYLYQSSQVDYLIFTGGVGNRDEVSEAEAGRAYAIANGVPQDVILIENYSTDTYSNLLNAQIIIADNHFESTLIVSDPYHMLRASIIAEEIGLQAEPSPTTTTRYRSPAPKSLSCYEKLTLWLYYTWQNVFGKTVMLDLTPA